MTAEICTRCGEDMTPFIKKVKRKVRSGEKREYVYDAWRCLPCEAKKKNERRASKEIQEFIRKGDGVAITPFNIPDIIVSKRNISNIIYRMRKDIRQSDHEEYRNSVRHRVNLLLKIKKDLARVVAMV